MKKALDLVVSTANASFQLIHEVNLAIEELCREANETENLRISVEDGCLNVKININGNNAYTQISINELYSQIKNIGNCNCYNEIVSIITNGIEENIFEYATYVK